MKTKLLAVIVLAVLLLCAGCADVAGEPEFICPVCNAAKAEVCSVGGAPCRSFYLRCTVCKTKSGRYKSFTKAFEKWEISNGGIQ